MFTTKLKNWFKKICFKMALKAAINEYLPGDMKFKGKVQMTPLCDCISLPPVIRGKVLTTGHIANLLNVPVHKIKYQITTLDIEHIAMAGDRRVFSQSALDKLTKIFEAKAS